jgi:hypothetical protein
MPPIPAEQTAPYPPNTAGQLLEAKQPQTALSLQRQQGDRGDTDADEGGHAARLPVFVRYPDLRAAGIVTSWMQLRRFIDGEGFPPGVLLGKNTRAWPLHEVEVWLAGRPSAPKLVNWEKGRQTKRRKQLEAEANRL